MPEITYLSDEHHWAPNDGWACSGLGVRLFQRDPGQEMEMSKAEVVAAIRNICEAVAESWPAESSRPWHDV